MNSKEYLLSIATNYVETLGSKYKFKVHDVLEFEEGFLITYQNEKYISSGNIKDLVIGVSPFIISKKDGEIFHEDTYLTTTELINHYKKRNGYLKRPFFITRNKKTNTK